MPSNLPDLPQPGSEVEPYEHFKTFLEAMTTDQLAETAIKAKAYAEVARKARAKREHREYQRIYLRALVELADSPPPGQGVGGGGDHRKHYNRGYSALPPVDMQRAREARWPDGNDHLEDCVETIESMAEPRLRALVRNVRSQHTPVDLGTLKEFDLILADPPWTYTENVADPTRTLDQHYPTMSLEDIKKLHPPAADDAVLLLWATSPLIRQQIDVMAEWGFTYKTQAVWVKDQIGMGYWFRQQHELLLVGTKGSPGAPEPANRPSSIIQGARREHSAKPEHLHDLLNGMFPHLPRKLEMFAREQRPGWVTWGNDAEVQDD
jgi:N6-adenosine-specific RNA methylase IME4